MNLKIAFVLAFNGIIFTTGLVKIGHLVQGLKCETDSQIDRETDRQRERQTGRKLVAEIHISLIKQGKETFSSRLCVWSCLFM
jgi:hypothetical protein